MAVTRNLYNQVMMLDNFTCVYCGLRTPDITVDHYIPRSLGGPDVLQNLVAACFSCNSSKSDRAPYEIGFVPRFGRFRYVTTAVYGAHEEFEAAVLQRLAEDPAFLAVVADTIRQHPGWYRTLPGAMPRRRWLSSAEDSAAAIEVEAEVEARIRRMAEQGMSRNEMAAELRGRRADALQKIREVLGPSM
jgi:hypothetical protein